MMSFRLFFDYSYVMQMCHTAFSILLPFLILFEFSVHSASVHLAKMSSDESLDSEMPYDSSDEVWEEEEVSRDDDIKNYNIIVLEQIFMLAALVFSSLSGE